MMRPVGVGLISISPIGVVRIHDHHVLAASPGLDCDLLGHELRALVVRRSCRSATRETLRRRCGRLS